jgi:prevent-host-death family protein
MDRTIPTDDTLDFEKAKEVAEDGPVILTTAGRPSFVILKYDDYRRLQSRGGSLADALRDDRPGADFEFEPPRLSDDWGLKIPTFDD